MKGEFRVRDRRNANWCWVEKVVLDKLGHVLGAHGISVYLILCRYANEEGHCWPAYRTIANLTGMSRPAVKKYAKWLEALGLIAIQERDRLENGGSTSNLFTLLDGVAAAERYDLEGPPDFDFGGGVHLAKKSKAGGGSTVTGGGSRVTGGGSLKTGGGGTNGTGGGVSEKPGGGSGGEKGGVITKPPGGSVETPKKTDLELAQLDKVLNQKDKRAAVKAAYAWAHEEFFKGRGERIPTPGLDEKRIERDIDYALRHHGLMVACGAVRGIFFSAHNTGGNERRELYIDITIALRPTNITRFFYLWRSQQPQAALDIASAGGPGSIVDRLGSAVRTECGRLPWLEPIAVRLDEVRAAITGETQVAEVERELISLDGEMIALAERSMSSADRSERDRLLEERTAELKKRVPEDELRSGRRRLVAQIVRRLLTLPSLSLYFEPFESAPPAQPVVAPVERTEPQVWTLLRGALREQLDPEDYKTWVMPLRVVESGDRLVLLAPNARFKHALEENFRDSIERAVLSLPLMPFDVLISDEAAAQ